MGSPISIAVPDYKTRCENCGQIPTVRIIDENGKTISPAEMCGVCTWGEADCIDPDNW